MGKAASLTEFAAAQGNPKAKCRICALPADVLAQVNAAHGSIPSTVVTRWLNTEHGLTLNVNGQPVRTHFHHA